MRARRKFHKKYENKTIKEKHEGRDQANFTDKNKAHKAMKESKQM